MIKRKVLSVVLPDGAADRIFNLLRVPTGHQYTIEKAYMVTDRDVTASTANYMQLNLVNGGTAGTATTTIGGTAGGTAGWTANTPKEITVTAGSGKLTAGQWLSANYDETGTVAPGSVTAFVEYVDGIGSKANA